MNNCNGNGVAVDGFCKCNEGYKFADCSKKVQQLKECSSKTCKMEITGPGWFTLAYDGSATDSLVSIKPSLKTDIYVTKDSKSDPNEFVYDIAFKGIAGETIKLGAKALGLAQDGKGYSIALYVDAINENKNELLDA